MNRRLPRAVATAACSALVALVCASCASVEQPAVDSTTEAQLPSDAASPPISVEGYVLGQGDRIGIQVFDEPELTMEAAIGASGVINYSYLGDLQVAGQTAQGLEQSITALLQDGYLVNPAVNVTVLAYRPFFINGEVRSPGSYPYQPGLTLDRAIALAGGLTDRASTRKMFVMRAEADGDARKAGMSTRIAPGDIVSIEEGFF